MPSVRGRQRLVVAATLFLSAVATGALAGFALGASLAWLPAAGVQVGNAALVALVGLAVVADLAWNTIGSPRPIRVEGQVPREWSSMFPAAVTAGLYGARLGVGPLTMLNTWMWWAASLGAALLGVVPSILVGTTFAAVKMLVIISTSLWAEGANHQPRFERLRRIRPGRPLSLVGAAAAALLLLGACSVGARPEFADEPMQQPSSDRSNDVQSAPATSEPEPTRITPSTTATTAREVDETSEVDPNVTEPDAADRQPADSDDSEPSTTITAAEPLAAALVQDLPGFEAIDDPVADRALDIEEAANIQPDPTEELPLLETRGFAGGWTRAFRNQARDVIVTTVYEFVDHEEAAFYLEDGLITIGGYGGQFFEVPDIEGSRGFRQEIDGGEPLLSVGVTFVRENRWFLVYVIGDAETVVPESLIEAARLQAAHADGST